MSDGEAEPRQLRIHFVRHGLVRNPKKVAQNAFPSLHPPLRKSRLCTRPGLLREIDGIQALGGGLATSRTSGRLLARLVPAFEEDLYFSHATSTSDD